MIRSCKDGPTRKALFRSLPWRRGEFLQGVPEIEWFPERVERPKFSLGGTERGGLSFHVAEWDATNGIGLQYWRDNEAWPLTIDCRSCAMNGRLSGKGIRPWNGERLTCIIGSARTDQEMKIFSKCSHMRRPEHCVLITPSEITDDIADVAMNWAQSWRLDGNTFGGFLCGAWNVYMRSTSTVTCFGHNPEWTPTIALHDKCKELGKMFLPGPKGVIKHSMIENPSGLEITTRNNVGVIRLSITSQLAPASLREARNPRIPWPLLMEGYSALYLGEKITMVGGLAEWMENPSIWPDETVGAWWRIYSR